MNNYKMSYTLYIDIMTRHSKNCTAHTVYTYYERKNDAQRSGFGTQEIRLGKDSVKALDCCCLSLQPAKDPVVTSDGFLYDRAVVLEYIVGQKAEIQRKLRLYEKQKARLNAEAKLLRKAEKEEEARRFLSLNTLDTHSQASAQAAEAEALASLPHKRNVMPGKNSCFWASASTPDQEFDKELMGKPDTVVRCPMSGKPLKYKDLVGVKFTSFEDDSKVMGFSQNKPVNREVKYCCAVSKDPLTNATFSTILQFIGNLKLPIYHVNSEQIKILKTPQDFFHGLLEHIGSANKRIILSTLYIGTGSLESELVIALKKAVCERNVKLTILMDATRGLRPSVTTKYYAGISNTDTSSSTKNLLEPIPHSSSHFLSHLTALPDVSVLLYSHPSPYKWIRYFLPNRWNEIFGVQHIKAYVFDDSVIMSGANLSHEYFTTRQDRTWLFKNVPSLANFYVDLIHVISKFCYSVCPDGNLIANSNDIASASSSIFRQKLHNALVNFLHSKQVESCSINAVKPMLTTDTYCIPLLQYGHCDIRYEEDFMQRLFKYFSHQVHSPFKLFLASGATVNLLCASPSANGFLNSNGISGYIPLAYREALIQLLQSFQSGLVNLSNVGVYEYHRPKWTFHAKGLWIDGVDGEDDSTNIRPYSLSLVGSSNYSYRSLNRDVESQLFVCTFNKQFSQHLQEERNHIFSSMYCYPVTLSQLTHQTDYRLPWYTRFMLPVFRRYM
ncbi:unnamed protein product [Heterobilharzia americana]|nr:unnamed protein product [Heterobilharzia americana]